MRFLIPTAIVASLLIPAAALACPNCIVHGTVQEDKAWSTIVGRKNPLIPPAATASTQVTAKPAKPASKAKVDVTAKTSK